MGNTEDMNTQGKSDLIPSLEELKKAYLNPDLHPYEREHAFYGYWMNRIREEGGLSHDSLVMIIEFRAWPAVSDLIYQLCKRDSVSEIDIDWLLTVFSNEGQFKFAREQLQALKTVHDRSMDWAEKLRCVLMLKADWAVPRVLSSLTSENHDQAVQIIASSSRPKRTRQLLIDALRKSP